MKTQKTPVMMLAASTALLTIAVYWGLFEFHVSVLQSPSPESGGLFGFGVSGAGDYNNDGYDDFIIGAPREGINGGLAYVFSGASGTVLSVLVPPFEQSSSWFGEVASCAGDLNDDGYAEVMVAAPIDGYNDNSGIVFVFSGASGDTMFTMGSPNTETGSRFGTAIDVAGDVNNDGVSDLIIGAPFECPDGVSTAGRAYVFSGEDGSLLYTLEPDFPAADGNFGESLSGLDDVNGDGHADFVVGAHGEAVNGVPGAGRVYVYNGATGDTLYTIDALAPQNGGLFGNTVESVGDLNEDGIHELAVGSTSADVEGTSWAGRVYIFNGVDGDTLMTLSSSFPGHAGNFGKPLARVTDIDGDNHDDLLVGAVGESIDGNARAGRVYVLSGATGDTISTIVHDAPYAHGNFGKSLAAAGDINNDGFGDVLIGLPEETIGGITQAGKVLMYASGPFAVGVTPSSDHQPSGFELRQNYPNPFNPSTSVEFEMRSAEWVSLEIFDVSGRHVNTLVDAWLAAGSHRVTWNGTNGAGDQVASGFYLYRVAAGEFTQTRRMLLMR